jgi:hypothetical protein
LALLVRFQLVFNHVYHNVIAHQAAGIHNLLGFPTKRRLFGDLSTQHVSGSLLVFQNRQRLIQVVLEKEVVFRTK